MINGEILPEDLPSCHIHQKYPTGIIHEYSIMERQASHAQPDLPLLYSKHTEGLYFPSFCN